MNQSYFLVGAMDLLRQLNQITSQRQWFITVDADGERYSMFATKDAVGLTEMPPTYPLGVCAMTAEELFYTLTILLVTEQRTQMQEGKYYNDVIADCVKTVCKV